MRRKLSLTLPILLLILSCATFERNTYSTLAISQSLYYQAMGAVSDFQDRGIITAEKRAEINKVAKLYKESHNTAVDAFEVYKRTQSAVDKEKLKTSIQAVFSKWEQLASLINTIRPNTVPATLK